MNIIRTITCLALLLAAISATAQDKPSIKWGKPTQEELTMTTYDPNPEAEAVILHKETTAKVDYVGDDFKLRTTVKCRIKVLKAQGKDWANGTILYRYNSGNPKGREILENLKAASFNLVDGKVVKTQMNKEMIFHEDISKTTRRTKFTVPQVTEGSIIEYEYTTLNDYFYLVDDWEAQESIPVKFTYYNFIAPEYFKFNLVETGLHHLANAHKQNRMTLSMRGGTMQCNCGDYNYYGYNLPELRKEPFCFNPRNFGQKVAAELRTVEIPGSTYKNFATTWSDIDKTLMESDDLGKMLNKNYLKDQMPTIPSDATTEEKIVTIYKALKAKVKWNKDYGLFASDKASTILKNGSGKNSDINILLIGMLRDAGLSAYPVVLRTRDEGLLPFASPTIQALSTFVVAVKDGEKLFYLDGSAEDGYINVIPSLLLAEKARIIYDERHADWLDISKVTNASTIAYINASLQPDGTITGTRSEKLGGLSAMGLRTHFKLAKDSTEFIKDIEKEDNMEITSFTHEGMTDYVPTLKVNYGFTVQCESAGDLIYVKPLIDNLMSTSPFTSDTREMPIEMPSVATTQVTCKIDLPEGVTIEEQPKNLMFKNPDGSLSFKFICSPTPGGITTTCTMSVGKTLFAPSDYEQVKAFFDEVVKAASEIIVLKKAAQ